MISPNHSTRYRVKLPNVTLRKLWIMNEYTASHSEVHNLHAVQITLKSQTLHRVSENAITKRGGFI